MGSRQERLTAADPTVRRSMVPWIGNLRVTLIAGVIVAHVATAYVVDVSWYYEERTTSTLTPTLLAFPVFLAAVYGLGPLFLVAGLLSPHSLQRKGPGGFARGRLLRLGVPLLLFTALIDPLTDFLGDLGSGLQGSAWDYVVNRTGTTDFGPMWFVVALLVLSLGYAAWRTISPQPVERDDVLGPWRLTAFAGAIAATSWVTWLACTYRDETFLNLNWAHWPQATFLFVLGVMAGERGWLDRFSAERTRRCGWIAVTGLLALTGLTVLSLGTDDFGSLVGGFHWQAASFAAITGVVAVALNLWVVAWFERRWNHQGPLVAHAARGSYAAYIIHPTVVVLLSLAVLPLSIPPEWKLLIVATVGVPAVFAVGYALSRLPGFGRIV